MTLASVWAAALLGHNGVVHKPGEASAIGVSSDFSDANCITIYNYGQNYVKQFDSTTGTTINLWWPDAHMPIAATIISETEILALSDTATGNEFKTYNYSAKTENNITDGSCDLGEESIKFVDPISNEPTFIFLDSGKVKTYSDSNKNCSSIADYPKIGSLGKGLLPDARFYGYAQHTNKRCWFLGTTDLGARVECFNSTGALIFSSERLDDGYRRNNDHTCGDIFFGADDHLYVANGDTDPGNLKEGRQQNIEFYAGKLIQFEITYENNFNATGEIKGVGFRNPWTTASIDGARFVGQVGQQTCETVYKMDLSIRQNFGWPKYEGPFFRSAVTPYKRDYADAERVFSDSYRSALPENFMFVLYILFFLLFAIGLGLVVYRRAKGEYNTFKLELMLLIAYLCVGLPQMTVSPGYIGNDNGVYATHMRLLVHSYSPKYNETYDEYFVMVFFLFFAVPLLISAVYWSSAYVAVTGSLFAFVYLVTFMALIEAPATITPLPVFAFVFVFVALYFAFKQIRERPQKYVAL